MNIEKVENYITNAANTFNINNIIINNNKNIKNNNTNIINNNNINIINNNISNNLNDKDYARSITSIEYWTN